MKYIEIYDYIYDYCESRNIQIDLRLLAYGDMNKFYSSRDDDYFQVMCVEYNVNNIENVKKLCSNIINDLWEEAIKPNHRIAMCISRIVEYDDWISISIGGCLFEDNTLL